MAATKDKGSPSETEQATSEAAQPSSPEPATGEMLLTYDKSTGQVIKIEHLSPSGSRQELTEEEYASFFGQGTEFGQGAEAEEPTGYDPYTVAFAVAHQQAGFEQGYYHGLIEYETALTGQTASGYSPEEEAAYYQGIADYHALAGGQ